MKASDLFIRCLEEEGVEYMFGVPGEENADIMISLLDSSIRFIVCRHEQAAAFMCDAYGRLTGKPTCCLGTLGPGATNLITGVADANMDRAPCVVLTGQAATTRLHKESHQAMDLVELFSPAVKWGASVQHPDSIPEIVRKAFRLACTDKFGATHIDLPENIAHMETVPAERPQPERDRAGGRRHPASAVPRHPDRERHPAQPGQRRAARFGAAERDPGGQHVHGQGRLSRVRPAQRVHRRVERA
jgi:acetolactate synthase-1/2/3 large subunit